MNKILYFICITGLFMSGLKKQSNEEFEFNADKD